MREEPDEVGLEEARTPADVTAFWLPWHDPDGGEFPFAAALRVVRDPVLAWRCNIP